jgi:hypothetical protein
VLEELNVLTNESETLINSVGLVILTAMLSFATALYLGRRREQRQRRELELAAHQKVLDRLAEVEGKLALVNQSVIPLNLAMQAMLIKELTHYHTPEMDGLMEKIGPPNTLEPSEEVRLGQLLTERTKDMGPTISPSERDAAFILPAVMRRAKVEAETIAGAEEMKLKLITVAAVVGVPVSISAEPIVNPNNR